FSTSPEGRLYRSGDLARYRSDGSIEFLGRIDNQVKIRGYRIELGEIESVIRLHPAAKEAVVVAREDVPGDQRLVAYVAPANAAAQTAELRRFLTERLPAHMLPSAFVFVDGFPATPNGKLDRKALPAPAGRSPDNSFVAPRSSIEKALGSIWCDVLNLQQIGIHDNFFELGGDSLLAFQVMSRGRNILQVEMAVRLIFEKPTIADLAKCIDETLCEENSAISIAPAARALPMSFAQERLWFIHQMDPESAVYNISLGLWLDGPLDISALSMSLEELVRRHEILRTRFDVVADQPVQIIEPVTAVEMPLIDLSTQLKREDDAMRLCQEEARRPFDLARDLMLRARLFRLEPQRHLLLLNVHHIAADGWSVRILMRELAILYEAFCQAQASPLQELPIQYADYAVWQRDWLQGEVLEQQLGYWRTQLAGAPALLELPTDRPRPARQSYRGATETAVLPSSLLTAVKALSRQEGTTLFTTLLAAFQTLLSRYSGQEDIAVGSPIAGRNRMELEGLVGFFVNTLVLRGDLSGNPTFRELLRRTKEVTLGAYAHQDLPFEKLVEVLQPERNLNYHPLFQVMFTSNTSPVPTQLGGLGLSLHGVSSATSKFDLTMSVSEETDGLKAQIEYSTDLFDADTIRRMLGHYQILLQGIAANPEARIAELPLLTEAERHQLLLEWNQTEVDYPRDKCVHQLFEAQVERTPDAVALVIEKSELSYAELNAQSNQLARFLQHYGVRQGRFVACYMERSFDLIVALLAILKSGGVYLALEKDIPSKRLYSILEDTQPAVIVVKSQRDKEAIKLAMVGAPVGSLPNVVCLDEHAKSIDYESKENIDLEITCDDLAY
ncbi:MAG: condensation domain-containing protein, partial [Pseudolabrys sp.]